MSLLLNIDTAVKTASVCLSNGETIIAEKVNPSEKESAAWLHVAIQDVLQEANLSVGQLAAIAVSAGPGSYTGLRVGMAAAKGLCYALQLPLISISTLQMMAAAVKEVSTQLLCPMIDARRMEVFTAIYDPALTEVAPSTNLILEETSFSHWLENHSITFFGNGSNKAAEVIKHPNAFFLPVSATAANMVSLSQKKLAQRQFTDLAYSEPQYGKDFHSSIYKKFY